MHLTCSYNVPLVSCAQTVGGSQLNLCLMGCVLFGSVQVQRVSLELAMPALMESITADSNHGQADFIADVDVMTVYLECMVYPHCCQPNLCIDPASWQMALLVVCHPVP